MPKPDDDILDSILGAERGTKPEVTEVVPELVEAADDVVISDAGAIRSNDASDERFDLIPIEPLRRIARVYAYGAKKRGPRNWEQGLDGSDTLNRALRHIYAWAEGREERPSTPTDNDDDLAHAVWNLLALMHHEDVFPERLLDIPGRARLSNQAKEGTHDNKTSKKQSP